MVCARNARKQNGIASISFLLQWFMHCKWIRHHRAGTCYSAGLVWTVGTMGTSSGGDDWRISSSFWLNAREGMACQPNASASATTNELSQSESNGEN